MNDGKVIGVWLDVPNVRCVFCRAKPSEMADPLLEFWANPEDLSLLCVSILHFGLRVFECLCKIGFKQVNNNDDIQKLSFHSC